MEKKFFKKRDLLFFAVLILLVALAFLAVSLFPKGSVAIVEHDGEMLLKQELSTLSSEQKYEFTGENGITLTVVLSPEGAQISESDCPDKTCVRTGRLTKAGESAICLPAKVSLKLEGKAGADAQTY